MEIAVVVKHTLTLTQTRACRGRQVPEQQRRLRQQTQMHLRGGIHDMWRLPRSEGLQRFVRVCPHVGELMYGAAKVEAKSQVGFAFKSDLSFYLYLLFVSQQPSKSSPPPDIAPTTFIRTEKDMMTSPRPQRGV